MFLPYEREKIRNLLLMEEAKEKAKPQLKDVNIISITYPIVIVNDNLFELEFKDEKPKLT